MSTNRFLKLLLAIVTCALVSACGLGTGVQESCTAGNVPYIRYKIVNNTSQTISVDDIDGQQKRNCPELKILQNHNVMAGAFYSGWLVDFVFYQDLMTLRTTDIAATKLIAIRQSPSAVSYYTGYPQALSADLASWLTVNQSYLTPGFYSPPPVAGSMDAYGLFYIVGNPGKIRLGLPTTNPERFDIYTSLDPLNRPYKFDNFTIIFTINGPNKSDVVISYQGTPQ